MRTVGGLFALGFLLYGEFIEKTQSIKISRNKGSVDASLTSFISQSQKLSASTTATSVCRFLYV